MGYQLHEANQLRYLDDSVVPRELALTRNSILIVDTNGIVRTLAVSSHTVIGRQGNGIVDNLMVANSLFGRGGTVSWQDIAIGLNALVLRGSGNLVVQGVADSEWVGRPPGGALGVVTAAEARAMLGCISKSKPADDPITSDATINDDGTLVAALEADEQYEFCLGAKVTSHAQPDFQWSITIPALATMLLTSVFVETGTTGGDWNTYTTSGTAIVETTGNTNPHSLIIVGHIRMGSGAGNVAWGWAQALSKANTTTVHKNSHMHIKEVD